MWWWREWQKWRFIDETKADSCVTCIERWLLCATPCVSSFDGDDHDLDHGHDHDHDHDDHDHLDWQMTPQRPQCVFNCVLVTHDPQGQPLEGQHLNIWKGNMWRWAIVFVATHIQQASVTGPGNILWKLLFFFIATDINCVTAHDPPGWANSCVINCCLYWLLNWTIAYDLTQECKYFFCCEAEPTKFDQLCRTGGLGKATLLRSPVCDKLLTVATLDFSQVSQPTCFWHSWQMKNLSQWSSQIWALWLAIACATQYHLPTGHSNYRWLTRWASTHIQSNWLGSDQFLLCSKIKRLQKKSSDKNTKSLSARMPSLVKWHSPNAVTDDSLLAAEMKLHTLQIAWNQAFL